MRRLAFLVTAFTLALLVTGGPAEAKRTKPRDLCAKDVDAALKTIGKECKQLLKTKDIDWKKVGRLFRKEAKKVETEQDHYVLLVRLLARAEDGHAYVEKLEPGKHIQFPKELTEKSSGPGMFWCRVGDKVYVKTAWNAAKEVGLAPGWEIVKVDDLPVLDWLEARVAELRDTSGFSTDHAAFTAACHWGLRDKVGARMKVQCRAPGESKLRKKTITYQGAKLGAHGPVFPPQGLKGDKNLVYGKTEAGHGYIHIRRCKGDLPTRIDEALAALDDPPGLILDFRANGGGGFDHDGFMGRFVPKGETITFGKRYASAGPKPYAGPIVVIVDGMTISAGETASGIFKEDGRGYLIGECPTAGMSSSKKTFPLPAGLFALYVSIHSKKARFNGGKGIEGIGVAPHEIVEYAPDDLAAGRDTMIQRAEALLDEYPQKQVPYVPERYGWRE